MLVNPISTVNSVNFRATIMPTPSLKEGFDLIERNADSIIMKDMNYAKDFLDSIAKIQDAKNINDFKIDIDKRRTNYTYTRINGRKVSGGPNERLNNLQDSYLVVESTKNYAAKLGKTEPSLLDFLKAQVEEAQRNLDELKVRYSERLKAEFEQAKKTIFEDVK